MTTIIVPGHLRSVLMSVLFFCLVARTHSTGSHLGSFYSTRTLEDGVHELTGFLEGVRVKQTVAGPMEGSPRGIVVRQLSTHRQVLSLVYNGLPPYLLISEGAPVASEASPVGRDMDDLELRDCRLEREKEAVEDFHRAFDRDALIAADVARQGTLPLSVVNGSYVELEGDEDVPSSLHSLFKFKELKHKCFQLNRKIRKSEKAKRKQEFRSEKRKNETSVLSRSRRGLHQLLILPGTKWCGNRRLAKSYNDLDGNSVADHCCRVHDLCPLSIPALSRKYGLYNFKLTTLSHCSCDKRFKTCLKQAGTGASDVVGKAFFSIFKSNCFNFQRRKVCKKRGFWKCLRYGYEKQAVIRRPIPWNY